LQETKIENLERSAKKRPPERIKTKVILYQEQKENNFSTPKANNKARVDTKTTTGTKKGFEGAQVKYYNINASREKSLSPNSFISTEKDIKSPHRKNGTMTNISEKISTNSIANANSLSPYHLTMVLSNKKENTNPNTAAKDKIENISTSHFLLDKTNSSISESLTPRYSDVHGKS